eukprot:1691894-Pleurochrysis_carterae.AAC.1
MPRVCACRASAHAPMSAHLSTARERAHSRSARAQGELARGLAMKQPARLLGVWRRIAQSCVSPRNMQNSLWRSHYMIYLGVNI